MNNVIANKTRLYFLAKKLKDLAIELDSLTEEEKRIIIEKADRKGSLVLKKLYDALNDYMGW